MRHRSIWALATIISALALATAATSATAAEWHVAGNPLTGSSTLATSVTGSFSMYSLGEEIQCSTVELKGAKITAPGTGSIEHLVLKGCFDETSGNCGLTSKTIESKPLTITAALGSKSPEDTLKLKPTSGTAFMEFELTGNVVECPRRGVNIVKGELREIMSKGGEELATQEITVKQEFNTQLAWDGSGTAITSTIQPKLATGQAWSFR